jgi:uncharacterized protein (TIGR02145 family)
MKKNLFLIIAMNGVQFFLSTFCFGFNNFVTTNDSVIDIDGNVYHTVTIGAQVWMIENLKTTRFNDGTTIPLVVEDTAWLNLKSPGYCFYNNDTANKKTFGALYNRYTINTGKIAPKGWHVPTDTEWTTLIDYLIANGYNFDGSTTGNKIAKSLAATTTWKLDSIVGTIGYDLTKNNTSGFAALPGGFRYATDINMLVQKKPEIVCFIGNQGCWWSSDQTDTSNGRFLGEWRGISIFGGRIFFEMSGVSVRCIKDQKDSARLGFGF